MTLVMGVLNATPDSFYEPSRVTPDEVGDRAEHMLSSGTDIIDVGAVSSRPGADGVAMELEWERLSAVLPAIVDVMSQHPHRTVTVSGLEFGLPLLSVDTTRAEIVRRVFELAGRFLVNDISAGEEDTGMLPLVGRLGLPYVAMHRRGDSATMDALVDYPCGVCVAVEDYFDDFAVRAARHGVTDWILDPGFGFAKTDDQNMELLHSLPRFKRFGRPILAGIADKRFTHGRTGELQRLAAARGADILRVHDAGRPSPFGCSQKQ